MPTSGDIVQVDLGVPSGAEAGMRRPAVVVTAQHVLAQGPRVIQIVPLTSRMRGHATEVVVTADLTNGLEHDSAAQCQHIRAVATDRITQSHGNVGALTLAQIRETIAVLLDL